MLLTGQYNFNCHRLLTDLRVNTVPNLNVLLIHLCVFNQTHIYRTEQFLLSWRTSRMEEERKDEIIKEKNKFERN